MPVTTAGGLILASAMVSEQAKTSAERQAAFRARKAETPEVRGIYAHPDDHARIKGYALKVAKQRAKPSR